MHFINRLLHEDIIVLAFGLWFLKTSWVTNLVLIIRIIIISSGIIIFIEEFCCRIFFFCLFNFIEA